MYFGACGHKAITENSNPEKKSAGTALFTAIYKKKIIVISNSLPYIN
jgi:hypothetical protein